MNSDQIPGVLFQMTPQLTKKKLVVWVKLQILPCVF